MEGVYRFQNGGMITIFLTPDLLEGKSRKKTAEYREVSCDGYFSEVRHDIEIKQDSENSKLYFEFFGEKKYLEDFEFIPINDLIDRLESAAEENFVTDDQIVATLLKEGNNITFNCPLSKIRYFVPQFGISLTNPCDTENVECILTENRYKKNYWPYKIELVAKESQDRYFFSGRDFYTSDFCSMLRDGRVRLIDPKKYISVMFIEEIKEGPVGFFRKLFRKR